MRSGVVYEIQVNRSTKDKGNAIDRGLFMCGCGRSGNWPGSGMGGASRLPWCRVVRILLHSTAVVLLVPSHKLGPIFLHLHLEAAKAITLDRFSCSSRIATYFGVRFDWSDQCKHLISCYVSRRIRCDT